MSMSQILSGLFSVLAVAANRVGVSPEIPTWLDLIAAFMAQGETAKNELIALDNHIKVLVAENRGPTADERAVWRARSDAAHEIIQNWNPETADEN